MRLPSVLAAVAVVALTAAPALATESKSSHSGNPIGNWLSSMFSESEDVQFQKQRQGVKRDVALLLFEYDLYVKDDEDAQTKFPTDQMMKMKDDYENKSFVIVTPTEEWKLYVKAFEVEKVQIYGALEIIKEDQKHFLNSFREANQMMSENYMNWNLKSFPVLEREFHTLRDRLNEIEGNSRKSYSDMKEARNSFIQFNENWKNLVIKVNNALEKRRTSLNSKGLFQTVSDSLSTIPNGLYNYWSPSPVGPSSTSEEDIKKGKDASLWSYFRSSPTSSQLPPSEVDEEIGEYAHNAWYFGAPTSEETENDSDPSPTTNPTSEVDAGKGKRLRA